jgi:adenosylcobinamide-phosphate synthase
MFSIFSVIHPPTWWVIPAAMALDAAVGDPRWLPHPIRWMGRCIEVFESPTRRWIKSERLAGAVFASALVLGCWALIATVVRAAYGVHPLIGAMLDTVLIFYSLSARSLHDAAMEIHDLLADDRVDAARSRLDWIVGRDVEHYASADIARATVETVAENFADGVVSPLFFAAIGGAPLALTYKMINTLDSMVGYKNTRYHRFGWAAARMDDLANWIPARLAVIIISLAARLLDVGHGRRALHAAVAEGAHHSSPNAGYPEAAFAGALAVRLNGPNYYKGVRVEKPYIGIAFGRVRIHHIRKACELMGLASVLAGAVAWIATLAGG